MEENLKLLQSHNVAQFFHTHQENTVKKMSNFSDVFKAGGLKKYLAQQKEKSEKEKRFKDLQLEEQEIKNRYIERQYKMQYKYFIFALIISLLALIVSLLSYLKK